MYSYEFFHKVNEIEEHLVDLKTSELNAYSKRELKDIRDFIHAPDIITHLTDEDLKNLENGKEIVITVQQTSTLKLKLV